MSNLSLFSRTSLTSGTTRGEARGAVGPAALVLPPHSAWQPGSSLAPVGDTEASWRRTASDLGRVCGSRHSTKGLRREQWPGGSVRREEPRRCFGGMLFHVWAKKK